MAAGRGRLSRRVTGGLGLPSLAVLVAACGGLAPGGRVGPIIDIDGVGTAVIVEPEPLEPDQITFMRWTAARVVLRTEDGRLVVVWNGGPSACWGFVSVHFSGRGRQVAASVGERQIPRPGPCTGERSLLAVFAPGTAAPVRDRTSEWPTQP